MLESEGWGRGTFTVGDKVTRDAKDVSTAWLRSNVRDYESIHGCFVCSGAPRYGGIFSVPGDYFLLEKKDEATLGTVMHLWYGSCIRSTPQTLGGVLRYRP